ncbi:hypothetical protein V5N11_025906 [Cardamine amara subsp. amara]|uniref:C2H2-type domain-containing protein n=1 Tax=Cardamine amara subsp. amara TaxID=228776 RepID=A0ABD1B329_CARAN
MTSFPNGLNAYGEDNMNMRGFTPIDMSSSFRNHESKMVRSVCTSSDQTNHRGLFSSSHVFNCYQHSHVSSSSFGFNNSHVTYQMEKNMASTFGMPCRTQVSGNSHLSQISFTQTITSRCSVVVPTNDFILPQNEYERAMNPNILNPSFYPSNFVDNRREILNPTPLNTIFPHQNYVFPRQLDLFSFSPNHHHDQDVLHRQSVKKRYRPTKYFEGFVSEKDGEYDGRTHSLPYQKYGPYTCPKCNNVFDTSQKFAAHISSVHYKNETMIEKEKRFNARNKKRSRTTSQMLHGESSKIQHEEDRVVEGGGGNNNIASGIEAFQHHLIVKEEPIYDLF